MSLPAPNLDDRTFQDLVNEARLRIPQLCPEWTDHNLSDPGIALIELFAWMTETLIYRANQVPDKNYLKFMDMVGIQLKPAVPARTNITLTLTAPQNVVLDIPSGTEVATVRTETEESTIFATDHDIEIIPPSMERFLLTRDGDEYQDRSDLLKDWTALRDMGVDPALQGDDSFPIFQQVPEPGDTLYLGYENLLRGHVLALDFDCVEAEGSGVNPNNPPIQWQYWDAMHQSWMDFAPLSNSLAWIESDDTRGFNIAGRIVLHMPRSAGRTVIDNFESFWIRCSVTDSEERQGKYVTTPRIRNVETQSIGAVVPTSNVTNVYEEVLGNSTGRPGQSFQTFNSPMLPLEIGELIEVQNEDGSGWEEWEVVENFLSSTPDSRHIVCDPVFSEIQFGPVIRGFNNNEVNYGAVPSAGSQVRIPRYRYGGGPEGNLGQNTLVVLKSAIPYVASVTNRQQATGGQLPETIDEAKLRAPQQFRTRDRAVTREDFEYLAVQASRDVVKAHCVQPIIPGIEPQIHDNLVKVLLISHRADEVEQPSISDLAIPQTVIDDVTGFLDERRLLGTSMFVQAAEFISVSLEAVVKLKTGANSDVAHSAVLDCLYAYIHPTKGGIDGEGWEFGRDFHVSELFSRIQIISEVDYTLEIKAYVVDPESGDRSDALQYIEVDPGITLRSDVHQVNFV